MNEFFILNMQIKRKKTKQYGKTAAGKTSNEKILIINNYRGFGDLDAVI